jgi:hypothetical protein
VDARDEPWHDETLAPNRRHQAGGAERAGRFSVMLGLVARLSGMMRAFLIFVMLGLVPSIHATAIYRSNAQRFQTAA